MNFAANIITQFEEHDRRIFWSIAAVLATVLALYIYFLGVSVYAVIARNHAEQDAGQTNTRIAQLESRYVALDKEINLALAHERGFSDIAVPRYLSQEAPKESFSLVTGGR